jgi:hypothetical protein
MQEWVEATGTEVCVGTVIGDDVWELYDGKSN